MSYIYINLAFLYSVVFASVTIEIIVNTDNIYYFYGDHATENHFGSSRYPQTVIYTRFNCRNEGGVGGVCLIGRWGGWGVGDWWL